MDRAIQRGVETVREVLTCSNMSVFGVMWRSACRDERQAPTLNVRPNITALSVLHRHHPLPHPIKHAPDYLCGSHLSLMHTHSPSHSQNTWNTPAPPPLLHTHTRASVQLLSCMICTPPPPSLRPYFYNQETKESQWDRPPDLAWRRIRVHGDTDTR